MWTYEPFVGTTVYFDEKRTVSLATTAFWEFHGHKKDTDTKVGQLLTLEGGVGQVIPRRRADPRRGVLRPVEAHRGSSWPSSSCRAEAGTSWISRASTRCLPFGPDVTLPVASKSKLFSLVNIRYLWETGARLKTQGQTLAVTATFPVPSVKLQ